jgi:hypothetical protein
MLILGLFPIQLKLNRDFQDPTLLNHIKNGIEFISFINKTQKLWGVQMQTLEVENSVIKIFGLESPK